MEGKKGSQTPFCNTQKKKKQKTTGANVLCLAKEKQRFAKSVLEQKKQGSTGYEGHLKSTLKKGQGSDTMKEIELNIFVYKIDLKQQSTLSYIGKRSLF
uniref:Uncharacterized protein n=1 Tax=Manihot esculenta TaxID=3983 RepID=A0A2C9V7B2_MANES